MKVSVIVPVYNAEKVLRFCVNSILNQTFKDFELILIDDGSTDGSGALCDEYALKFENLRVKHIENQGVSVARNIGIELAKGDYICFVDSDDYVAENYLEELTRLITSNNDNIWCGFQTVDGYENAKVLQKVFFSDKESFSYSNVNEIMTLHDKWLDAGPVCKLYKRSVIEENQIRFPEALSLGEDLLFNYEYLDCTSGSIVIINKCLYNYVKQSGDSLTKTYHEDLFTKYKKINSTVFSYLSKWRCGQDQITKFYNSSFYLYEFVLRNTFKPASTQKKRYRYNRSIMKSREFKNSLNNSDCYINPVYRFGYSHAMSWFVRLLDKMTYLR